MKKLFAAVMTLTLMACGVGAPESAAVSLSVRVGAKKGTTTQPLRQELTLDSGVTVDRIRIVVRELELESTTALTGSSADDGDGGTDDSSTRSSSSGFEIEKGPYLIDLEGAELEGGVQQLLAAELPAGDYREIEFKVQKLMGAERSTPGFEDLVAADASVIVNGTIDGQPFEFVSGLDEDQEYEGHIVIGENGDNVTLNIDPRGWFKDSAGNRLDPRDASAKSRIEANIKASIDAFEDDDHDGAHDLDDDHGVDRNDDH